MKIDHREIIFLSEIDGENTNFDINRMEFNNLTSHNAHTPEEARVPFSISRFCGWIIVLVSWFHKYFIFLELGQNIYFKPFIPVSEVNYFEPPLVGLK